jgi:hypothetical protein
MNDSREMHLTNELIENNHNDSNSSLFSKDKENLARKSHKKKIIYLAIFILGISFSSPVLMPIGIICASILLFQKNRKVILLGLITIFIQFFILAFFAYSMGLI